MNEKLLENINSGIWRQICRRLILKTSPKETSPHNYTGKKLAISEPGREFVYRDPWKPLEGVIAHLTRECGGNVRDKGIVTTSSVYNNLMSYHPTNAVDFGTGIKSREKPLDTGKTP